MASTTASLLQRVHERIRRWPCKNMPPTYRGLLRTPMKKWRSYTMFRHICTESIAHLSSILILRYTGGRSGLDLNAKPTSESTTTRLQVLSYIYLPSIC